MTSRLPIELLACLLLCGCAGPTFTADTAPDYAVVVTAAPLYRFGPQQSTPPDARLLKDDHVRMLRREFGYSLVIADDGTTGYVANMDLKPLPPRPARIAEPIERDLPPPPPVEPPLPKPDMDVIPTDAPPSN